MHDVSPAVADERRRALRGLVGALVVATCAPGLHAVESDPLPVPVGTSRERAVRLYNEGVGHLVERRFADAERLFEQALALDEALAEAHNNLAFSVRMQGVQHFDRSLRHYNRAIELKPTLAQAYMYRGVLYTQMGDLARAKADHARLLTMDRELAAKLDKAIAGGGRDDRAGIASQYD